MAASHDWIQWLPASLYLAGALACAVRGQRHGWILLATSTRLALGAATLQCLLALAATPSRGGSHAVAAVVAQLVAFLGWIIGDYARRYLDGESGQRRFTIAFLGTLASVSAVVASGHLALTIVAWAASSIGLHHLLTFYRDRPAAQAVAHKKFLASRLAEACLVVAAMLLYRAWGTLDLAALGAQAAAGPLPAGATAAAVLIAAAVILKSAQLPLHGWLIQVMEAPTPVSALLHAGIVNLGGYVLIRLSPLIGASGAAQALLVVVGSLTAALAGLVMLTRITIKVRLAWSTCSQMGLMLVECGLGLYDLALVHLLAHALYKAHAFLSAGDAVRASLERDLVDGRERVPLSFASATLALLIAALVVLASAAAWHRVLDMPPLAWISVVLVSCGLATLLWPAAQDRRGVVRALGILLAATQLYLGWHTLAGAGLSVGTVSSPPALQAWAGFVFLALYASQAWLRSASSTAIPRSLYEWVHAGFYLDERFTRLTFRLWPPAPPRRRADDDRQPPALEHRSPA